MTNKVEQVFKNTLGQLHAMEAALEHLGAMHSNDERLKDAEIALHTCIGEIERASKRPGPGEKWDCNVRGHEDNGDFMYGNCKHCGLDLG